MKHLIRYIKKVFKVIQRKLICATMFVNVPFYMKTYVKYLRKHGMDIQGMPNYFYNDVHFDGKDYGIIHIGNNVTISREVLFLTHDYSMHTVFAGGESGMAIPDAEVLKQQDQIDKLLILREIRVEDNCFIGARATLLPGTHIGKNSIVGAGAVVKGKIPEGSIVVGNPAKVIGKTDEWLQKKAELLKEKGVLL